MFRVFTLSWANLERFLTDLENFATGAYQILSITSKDNMVAVVVKFTIADPEFDEEMITKKLG